MGYTCNQTGISIPAKGCGHKIPLQGTMPCDVAQDKPASAGWGGCKAKLHH